MDGSFRKPLRMESIGIVVHLSRSFECNTHKKSVLKIFDDLDNCHSAEMEPMVYRALNIKTKPPFYQFGNISDAISVDGFVVMWLKFIKIIP